MSQTIIASTANASDNDLAAPASRERVARTAHALREHGFTVYLVDTVDEARALVHELLPTNRTILTVSSETLRATGLDRDINESGQFHAVRPIFSKLDRETHRDERRRLGAAPDVVVGSVQAVTEDGSLVIVSGTGSQLGPYAAGAARAIWIVGAQKIVPDLTAAVQRIREYTHKLESARLEQLSGSPSVISKWLIIEREHVPGRGIVVLVNQSIGY